ncbi:hypothetical protein Tco_0543957 [Tanacetum coccineum]
MAKGKITNYGMLSRGKGPITLNVYRDDGSDEIIQNFKVNDLHLGEWREVMNAYPNKTKARWTTVNSQIRHRLDALHKTKVELELDFNKPLDEQDPIIKLNLLAKKRRKNIDDLCDYFKSTKMYKRYVQFADHQAGTVMNEPSLGMTLFNSSQRKDFINIEDFKELNIEMMYNVQEIFFRLHQGSGINDLARTFSTFLVDEVEKRNLNPNKQMRLIEQLRK